MQTRTYGNRIGPDDRTLRGLFGNNTTADTQFYTNISRATTAGLLAGSYHFVTPDTTNGTAEANNYIAVAGMYMKPGYMLPVYDLEDGNTENTPAQLTAWSMDFINTIFNSFRPGTELNWNGQKLCVFVQDFL